jgi:hypothetical protein
VIDRGTQGSGQARTTPLYETPKLFGFIPHSFIDEVQAQAATVGRAVVEQLTMRDSFPVNEYGQVDERRKGAPLREMPMDGEVYKVTGLSRKGAI